MPPLWHNIRREISVSTSMELAIGQSTDVPTRSAHIMNDDSSREIANLPPGSAKTAAKIGVFPVQEITLVKALHFGQRFPPGQHARTGNQIGRASCRES